MVTGPIVAFAGPAGGLGQSRFRADWEASRNSVKAKIRFEYQCMRIPVYAPLTAQTAR